MSKAAVFTMKLEPELRDEFMAEAEAIDRPASQIMRELMRNFVQSQKEARDYSDFLRSKVTAARQDIQNGNYTDANDLEAQFAVRKRLLLESVSKTSK